MEGNIQCAFPCSTTIENAAFPILSPMLVPLIPDEAFGAFQERVAKLVARPDEKVEDIQVHFVFYGRVMPLSSEEVLTDRSDIQTQWKDCRTTGVMVHIGVDHTPA